MEPIIWEPGVAPGKFRQGGWCFLRRGGCSPLALPWRHPCWELSYPHIYTHSPLSSTSPNTFLVLSSFIVGQFHLSCWNCRWHSSMAICTPKPMVRITWGLFSHSRVWMTLRLGVVVQSPLLNGLYAELKLRYLRKKAQFRLINQTTIIFFSFHFYLFITG